METPVSKTPPRPPAESIAEDIEQFYFGLIGELVDVELGFHKARERFSQMLANNGVRLNPDSLVKQLELVNDRMVRLMIVKHIGNRVGLAGELERIMEAEIELIYRSRMPDPTTHKLIVGDSKT